jgi:predicted metal-dependent HD superfamily phosphohydrolase
MRCDGIERGGGTIDAMGSDEHELRAAWSSRVGDSRAARALFDSLIGRHREPHRHYHGVRHVTWVVRHVEELAAAEPVDDVDAVVVAAFFHDAVYDPLAPDNEAASARLAERELTELGWIEPRRRRVTTMVEATATHVVAAAGFEPGLEVDTAVLLDADLAVLGSEPASYQAYVAGVRSEYGHVSATDWCTGRTRILQSFLDRPSLFATPTGRTRWESRARANIAAEVASLSGPTYR